MHDIGGVPLRRIGVPGRANYSQIERQARVVRQAAPGRVMLRAIPWLRDRNHLGSGTLRGSDSVGHGLCTKLKVFVFKCLHENQYEASVFGLTHGVTYGMI